MPPKAAQDTGFSAFDRAFSPDYLSVRKDVTPVMLQTAQGKTKQVLDYLMAPGEHREVEVHDKNRDGNSLLHLAVANRHAELARGLLQLRADPNVRNSMDMNALEYAVSQGVRTPTAKAVLSFCDFVVPETCQGPYWIKSMQAAQTLQQEGLTLVPTSLVGRLPELQRAAKKEFAEYTSNWLKDVRHMVCTVRNGIVLLNSEVGYLERDAWLTGCLDMPVSRRYVFLPDVEEIQKYTAAMRDPDVYQGLVTQRMMEACFTGQLEPVMGLLKASAPADVQDAYGETALMRASQHGDQEIVRCLLQARAKVDTQSKDGFTAFLLAASANHPEVVRTLLRARADPMTKSRKGFTMMSFVKHQGHKAVLKVFEEEREKTHAVAKAKASPKFAPAKRSSWNPFGW